jgi:hypothetical protein
LPKNRLLPESLSSIASCLSVDAPDGVDAIALIVQTFTSAEFPRESSISLFFLFPSEYKVHIMHNVIFLFFPNVKSIFQSIFETTRLTEANEKEIVCQQKYEG